MRSLHAAVVTALLLFVAAPALAQRPRHLPAYPRHLYPYGGFGLGYFYYYDLWNPAVWSSYGFFHGRSSVSLNGAVTEAPRRDHPVERHHHTERRAKP